MATWLEKYKAGLDAIVAKNEAIKQTYTPVNAVNPTDDTLARALAVMRASSAQQSGTVVSQNIKGDSDTGVYGKVDAASKKFNSGFNKGAANTADFVFENAMRFGNAFRNDFISQYRYNKENPNEPINPATLAKRLKIHNDATWRGFLNKEKVSGRDILKELGTKGNKTTAIGGFAIDMIDPINLVGGAQVKGTYRATKGLLSHITGRKAAEKIITNPAAHAAANAAEKPLVEAGVAETIADAAKVKAKPPETPLPFIESVAAARPAPRAATSRVADAAPEVDLAAAAKVKAPPGASKNDLKLVASRAKVDAINAQLAKIPSYVTDAPVTAAAKPVAAKVSGGAAKVTKAKGLAPEVARKKAFYQFVVSNPDTKITVGKSVVPVKRLLDMAKTADKEGARKIQDLIIAHAQKLAKASPEYFGGKSPTVQLWGKSGNVGAGKSSPASISVDELQKLLEGSPVPKNKAGIYTTADDAVDYPLHSADDLEGLHVTDIKGNVEPVGKYIERLTGIKPPTVSLKNSADALIDEAPVIPGADSVASAAVKPTRSPGPVGFMGPHGVSDLHQAIIDGKVDVEDLKDLMALTKTKSPTELKAALEKTIQSAAKLEDSASKTRGGQIDQSLWDTAPPAAVKEAADAAPAVTKVVPAEQIVREVIEHGDTSKLASTMDTLDPRQVKDVDAVLSFVVNKEILDPISLAKYPFHTKKGTARTRPERHAGTGRELRHWNKWSQYTTVNAIMQQKGIDELIAKAIPEGTPGARGLRAVAKRDHVMPVMRSVDKILRAEGIAPRLGTRDNRFAVSIFDVMDSVRPEFLTAHMFDMIPNVNQHIAPTMWSDLGTVMLEHATGKLTFDEARFSLGHILGKVSKNPHSGKTIPNGVASNYGKMLKAGDKDGASRYLASIVDEFMGATEGLAAKMQKNIAELTAVNVNLSKAVTVKTLKAFAYLVDQPNFTPTDYLKLALDRDTITESIAKQLGISSPVAKALALEEVAVKTAAAFPPEVVATATSHARVANAPNAAARDRALLDRAAENEINANAIGEELGESLTDIGRRTERGFAYSLVKLFAGHLSNAKVRPFMTSNISASQAVAKMYQDKFAQISRAFVKEDIDAAWSSLQRGNIPSEPNVLAAHKELRQAVDSLFTDDPKLNFFAVHGVEPYDFNKFAAKYGIKDEYHLTPETAADGWRSWRTADPLDLLSRVQGAMQSAAAHRNLGIELSKEFGSKVKTAEFDTLVDPKGSTLGRYLVPGTYYPKEIVKQMSVLDASMKLLDKPQEFNKILRVYDFAIHALKAGLTIYRLGHHFRNEVGDITFSWLAGVNDPRVYTKAIKVMTQNRGQYKDWSAMKALADQGIPNPKSTDIILTTIINGKKTQLNTGEVYAMAWKRGLLPDYRTLEDVGVLGEPIKNPFHLPGKWEGKAHKAASKVSEVRDHHVRLAHFIDVLQKGKFKDLDDAAQQATQIVRKWHPDGSDLTNFESQVARRMFLFYSWQRKAIPLVLEGLVMSPGKTLAIPRAMQALAQSNGIDPDSLANPFPSDQLFPSWISDDVFGPIYGNNNDGYWGINPGFPSVDIAQDYGTPMQAMKTMVGSLSPPFKQIGEIVHGSSQGKVSVDAKTGIPQKDLSDYIDSQIPGINSIAGITKRSPSSLFTQKRGVGLGMTPEQKAKAEAKNPTKNGTDMTALINYLTGIGLKDMSKPSYIKQAEMQAGGKIR